MTPQTGTSAWNSNLDVRKSKLFLENVRILPKMGQSVRPNAFLFWIFFLFIFISNHLNKLLGRLASFFFWFVALLCRKIHFLLSDLAIFAKPKEILTKSTVCGRKYRTFYQKFFDFLTSRNAFWAKVPMRKVVQNDSFYRFPNKFFGKFFWGNRLCRFYTLLIPKVTLFVASLEESVSSVLVCSLKKHFKNILMRIDRIDHSEQLFPLELLLKMRSYLSGNRRNFEQVYGFSPTKHTFSKEFLTF